MPTSSRRLAIVGLRNSKWSNFSLKTLGVVDYGVGNLRSVANALDYIGTQWGIVSSPDQVSEFDRLLLPGVGAFGSAMDRLEKTGLKESLLQAYRRGQPLLGICLGMQLLTEGSEESPSVDGLGIIPGMTTKLPGGGIETNTGFRTVTAVDGDRSLVWDKPERDYYFNHGFRVEPTAAVSVGTTTWGGLSICAAVEFENASGVQFHPEKSQGQGLALLKNFATSGSLRL